MWLLSKLYVWRGVNGAQQQYVYAELIVQTIYALRRVTSTVFTAWKLTANGMRNFTHWVRSGKPMWSDWKFDANENEALYCDLCDLGTCGSLRNERQLSTPSYMFFNRHTNVHIYVYSSRFVILDKMIVCPRLFMSSLTLCATIHNFD